MRPPGRSHFTDCAIKSTSGATAFCVLVAPTTVRRVRVIRRARGLFSRIGALGDRDLRAEWWICHQHVDAAEWDEFFRGFVSRQMAIRKRQRIHMKNVTFSIRGHENIHRARTNKKGIKVCAKKLFLRISTQAVVNSLLGLVARLAFIFSLGSAGVGERGWRRESRPCHTPGRAPSRFPLDREYELSGSRPGVA